MQQNENNILIYQDDNGITKVNVRFLMKTLSYRKIELIRISY